MAASIGKTPPAPNVFVQRNISSTAVGRIGSDAGVPTKKGGAPIGTLEQAVAATAGGCVKRWGLIKPTTRLAFTSEVCCAYTVFLYIEKS
jgi:hypothetical protein